MSSNKIKFAVMSITWNNPGGDDFIPWLKEVKEAGYEGISCFVNDLNRFMDNPTILLELLNNHNLTLVSVSTQLNSDFDRYKEILQFMQALHCKYLVCIDPAGTEKAYVKYATILNEIGLLAQTYQIQVHYHNHSDSVGETFTDMDNLIAELDFNKVSLMLDIGHATKDFIEFPYQDRAVKFLEKYWDRITFMEWKDWNEVTQLNTPLGEGLTDYDRIFELIRQRGYSGWITIEQNGNDGLSLGRSPFTCAKISRDFVKKRCYYSQPHKKRHAEQG